MIGRSIVHRLMVPAVVLVLATGAAVGFLGFINAKDAVGGIAAGLRGQMSGRVVDHLRVFFEDHEAVLDATASAIAAGDIDGADTSGLERHLLRQARTFGHLTSLYFANPLGGLVGSSHDGLRASFYILATDGFAAGRLVKHEVDAGGAKGRPLQSFAHFDARTRPWYLAALDDDAARFSDIYVLATGQDMALAQSRAVRDRAGRLMGVLGIDVFVSQFSEFLKASHGGMPGLSFIVDAAGLLVATSSGEPLFAERGDGRPGQRIAAADSANADIASAARAIRERLDPTAAVDGGLSLMVELPTGRDFVEAVPFRMNGLSWLAVTVVPEAAYLAPVLAGNQRTLALILAATAAMALLMWLLVRRIAAPLRRLTVLTRSIEGDRFEGPVPRFGDDEIGDLARAFAEMLGRLRSAKEERDRLFRQSREAELRWRFALEGAGNGVWDWNIRTGEVFYSRRWKEMLGFAEDEVGPTLDEWSRRIHPDDREGCLEDVRRHLAGETEIYSNEHRVLCRDGLYKWIQDRGKVVERDADGAPLRAVGIHQDVTQQRHAEECLRHAQKMEAVGQLTGGIAHEFNNIFQAIEGTLAFGRELASGDPRLDEVLADAQSAQRRGGMLTRQLVAFARHQVLRPEALAAGALIEDIMTLVAGLFGDDVDVLVDIDPGSGSILVDRQELTSAFLNIVLNARWAMPEGGTLIVTSARRRIVAGAADAGVAPGDYVEIAIADTGFGMAEAIRRRAFEPFFTTKEVGAGSGLGLSMVHGFARQSGGAATIESAVGKGTTVRLLLPAVPETTAA